MKIIVVGSSNTDMIIKTERIPKPGETVIGGAFSMAAGGKGANQAVAAARAGGQVTFIARVGADLFGEQAVVGFIADGIEVTHVLRDKRSPSGVALIYVDRKGENSIAVASGANAQLAPADVRRARAEIAAADVLLMQLETPLETIAAAAEIAAKHHVPVILNPAPAQPLPPALLEKITILTPNEHEAELLTGIAVNNARDAAAAAENLLARGVGMVIITLGAKGAYVHAADFKGMVPGFSVAAVDTTAAGDVFNGALAVALGERRPLAEAVRFAHAAAALSVTKLGAQPSAPQRRAIQRLCKSGGGAA
ncbi:MAG TPA: ribokinase [bacterium]|nr:ribokinase [bacterium]HPR88478.1 ribokinase [bacterium]